MPYATGLQCIFCGATYEIGSREIYAGCPRCKTAQFAANVTVTYDYAAIRRTISRASFSSRRHDLWRYHELLPVDESEAVSLGEGMTPLLPAPELGKKLGVTELYLKEESRNPTWSFKDRFNSTAISMGRQLGYTVAIAASSGNHGASTAAYAAKAGMGAVVLTQTYVPLAMKTLMQVYGAVVVALENKDERRPLLEKTVNEWGWYPVNVYATPPNGSVCYGVEGCKTMAYEICEQMEWVAPDWVVMPTDFGDGLSGIWKGFREFCDLGMVERTPQMVAAERFGPVANAIAHGLNYTTPVPTTSTVAFSIGTAMSAYQAIKAVTDSHGIACGVETEEEILEMQKELAQTEGIFAEGAAVVGLVALRKLVRQGRIRPDQRVVAVLTSSGLKDPEGPRAALPAWPTVNTPTLGTLREAIAGSYPGLAACAQVRSDAMLMNEDRAAQIMDREGLDALIATTPENIAYLSEFGVEKLSHWAGGRRENYALYPQDRALETALVISAGAVDVAAQDMAQGRMTLQDIRCVGDTVIFRAEGADLTPELAHLERLLARAPHVASSLEGLASAICDRGLEHKRLGIDEMHMPPGRMERLIKRLPQAHFVDAYDLFREIRAVKTPEEVSRLRTAIQISQAAFAETLSIIKEGVSEREVVIALRGEMARRGGIPRGDSLGAGPRSALPAAFATDYRIRRGDFLKFDFGAWYQFYHADIVRMLVVGAPSAKQAAYFHAIRAGQQWAIQGLHPGARVAEIFDMAVKGVQAAGIPHYARKHTGHGIGLEGYDVPLVAPEDKTVLEAGMVVNIETPYYEMGWGGMNVEDTLLITPDGSQYLTQGGHDLIAL